MKSQKRKVPAVRTAKPAHAASHRGPVLFQRPERTKEEVIAFNRRLSAAHIVVAAAYPTRLASSQNWQIWQAAVSEKYALYKEGVTLHAQHFSRTVIPADVARYDWDFWRDMALLKGGDQVHLGTSYYYSWKLIPGFLDRVMLKKTSFPPSIAWLSLQVLRHACRLLS